MSIKFLSPDMKDEFYTPERCYILELLNDMSNPAYSIARARVELGVTTAWHRLNGVEECYFILSGTGMVEIGEEFKQKVKSGDFVRIPPGKAQRIQNLGQEDLYFLCICTPAFSDECYIGLE